MILTVYNDFGREFVVKLVRHGEATYTPPGAEAHFKDDNHDPAVEFYDAQGVGSDFHAAEGEFIASVYRSTLLSRDHYPEGLSLAGERPEWHINKRSMSLVLNWLVADPAYNVEINVFSSHGSFTVGASQGHVHVRHLAASAPRDMRNIIRFDLGEWLQFWKLPLPDSIDVLDLGYWYVDHRGHTQYQRPEYEWRREVIEGVSSAEKE